MLFLSITLLVAILIISVQVLLRLKNRWPAKLQRQQSQQKSPAPTAPNKSSIIKQAANGSGPAKQVHFAEVLCTRSKAQNHAKTHNSSTQQAGSVTSVKQQAQANNKNGHNKNTKAHNANKRIPRQRHNSENDKINYSSEQLFKIIEVSCLSKEEVEMAVESLLNKLESGDAQWRQPKSDPLLKLRNQLRDSEAALATEAQNHEQTRARLAELKLQLQSERSSKTLALTETANAKKSLKNLEMINNQQEELIQRLNEERQINETAMKQTLSEMEKELRELNDQLGRELSDAGQREQKLAIKMKQLREGLSELFPDLKADAVHSSSDDWVNGYLIALKQLTRTVDELRCSNNNNLNRVSEDKMMGEYSPCSSPSKRSVVDKSTITLHTNNRIGRVGSPIVSQLDDATDALGASGTFVPEPSNWKEKPLIMLGPTDSDLDAPPHWFA